MHNIVMQILFIMIWMWTPIHERFVRESSVHKFIKILAWRPNHDLLKHQASVLKCSKILLMAQTHEICIHQASVHIHIYIYQDFAVDANS